MSKNHLRFVLDNFHLIHIKFLLGDIKNISYIMTAFYTQDVDNSDKQMIHEMNENINNMKGAFKQIMNIQKEMQKEISEISRNSTSKKDQ